jgi:hypothetical protein
VQRDGKNNRPKPGTLVSCFRGFSNGLTGRSVSGVMYGVVVNDPATFTKMPQRLVSVRFYGERHAMKCFPWDLTIEDINSEEVRAAIAAQLLTGEPVEPADAR